MPFANSFHHFPYYRSSFFLVEHILLTRIQQYLQISFICG